MATMGQSAVRERHELPVGFATPAARDAAPPRQAAIKALLDDLYGAVLEPSRVAAALKSFARVFDAAEAWLAVHDERGYVSVRERSALAEPDATLVQRFAGTIDNWHGDHGAVRLGTVPARRPAHETPVHYLAITCECPGRSAISILAVRRLPFGENEHDTAALLADDVCRALRLRDRSHADEAPAGLQLFEHTSIALFTTRQRVMERGNAAATALLALGRPVGVVAGKLRFDDSRAQAAFELMARPDAQANGARSLAFVVDGAARSTWIAQLSLHREPSVVIVALTPFSGASGTREAVLEGFTELTPTERTIFAAFVDGEDIAAIAAGMGRSIETVRWHVRNLFTKLGVNSQADLVRLGALLLPL